jgi:hypothetical protein
MAMNHCYSFRIFQLIVNLFTFVLLSQFLNGKTIKDIRSSSGSIEDFVRVDLGISETMKDTRPIYYVDFNNDK